MGFIAASNIQALTVTEQYIAKYNENMKYYNQHEVPIVNSFRSMYNGSIAHQIVGRAIWYMEYGYMIYGHSNYVNDGKVDCSNFVSLVYNNFGYSLTTFSAKYNTVGVPVADVSSQLQPGSKSKYMLVGVENLKPGDIFTFWAIDSTGKRVITHVGIYIGQIDGKPCIIHTIGKNRPTAIGITNSFTYWYGQHFAGARRVLPDSAYVPQQASIPKVYALPPQGAVVLPQNLPAGF